MPTVFSPLIFGLIAFRHTVHDLAMSFIRPSLFAGPNAQSSCRERNKITHSRSLTSTTHEHRVPLLSDKTPLTFGHTRVLAGLAGLRGEHGDGALIGPRHRERRAEVLVRDVGVEALQQPLLRVLERQVRLHLRFMT